MISMAVCLVPSSYPTDVGKTGWYLFGTAPYHPDSEGQSYTFTVTAD